MKILTAILILAVALAAQAVKDVTEFTIFKRSEPVKILPGVEISLKATDVVKQRFAVDITTDGHKIERKDFDIRIPIYFYVGTNTQPHEFVVMKVAADQIVGRISSPK